MNVGPLEMSMDLDSNEQNFVFIRDWFCMPDNLLIFKKKCKLSHTIKDLNFTVTKLQI